MGGRFMLCLNDAICACVGRFALRCPDASRLKRLSMFCGPAWPSSTMSFRTFSCDAFSLLSARLQRTSVDAVKRKTQMHTVTRTASAVERWKEAQHGSAGQQLQAAQLCATKKRSMLNGLRFCSCTGCNASARVHALSGCIFGLCFLCGPVFTVLSPPAAPLCVQDHCMSA